MRLGVINSGSDLHLLDHLGPLSVYLKAPFLVVERPNYELALQYYPQADVAFLPFWETKYPLLAEQFDVLFESKKWTENPSKVFREKFGKEMRLIFCPHGQSDKGYQAPLLASYASQDGVLLYGDLLIQMLKELNIWSLIPRHAVTGNYRLSFYEQHKEFYDRAAREKLPLDPNKKTLLYAPTWNDYDHATSFFEHGLKVISELPSDWNLIVKPHPLLEQHNAGLYYSIALQVEKKPNAFLLENFPPVYPVLSLADVYLGDTSSVGYDFLHFERSMFFFPSKHTGRLHACGRRIDPTQDLSSQLDEPNRFAKEQRELFHFAFGPRISAEQLRANVMKMLFKEN